MLVGGGKYNMALTNIEHRSGVFRIDHSPWVRLWWGLVIGLVILVLWTSLLVYWFMHDSFFSGNEFDPAKAGQFGDMFGALNCLFSGMALTGVALAVLYEHRALVLIRCQVEDSRKEAERSEEERRKTLILMSRQADALLTAAKLNAAHSIFQACPQSPTSVVFLEDGGNHFETRDKYRQYLQILLNDLPGAIQLGSAASVSTMSSHRKFMLWLVLDAKHRLCGSAVWEHSLALSDVKSLFKEFGLMSLQDGLLGSPDESDWKSAHRELHEMIEKMSVPDYHRECGRDDVNAALSRIEHTIRSAALA
jgi:hypothetical protein